MCPSRVARAIAEYIPQDYFDPQVRREEFKLGCTARNNFLANFIAAARDARRRAGGLDFV